MISFKEACDQIGYNRSMKAPQPQHKYFAYKDGKVFEYDTAEQAKAVSKLFERVVINSDEIKAFWDRQNELERAAANIWLEALRAEYSDITGSQFNLIYDDAYDRGHSEGYDRVAEVFGNLYTLCVAFADAGEK